MPRRTGAQALIAIGLQTGVSDNHSRYLCMGRHLTQNRIVGANVEDGRVESSAFASLGATLKGNAFGAPTSKVDQPFRRTFAPNSKGATLPGLIRQGR